MANIETKINSLIKSNPVKPHVVDGQKRFEVCGISFASESVAKFYVNLWATNEAYAGERS